MADWHWEPVTDDLLDKLPPAALAAVRQVAEELTVRESIIFLDGPEFTGEPPGLRTVQRGPLMLVYLAWHPDRRAKAAALAARSVDVVGNLRAAIVPRPGLRGTRPGGVRRFPAGS